MRARGTLRAVRTEDLLEVLGLQPIEHEPSKVEQDGRRLGLDRSSQANLLESAQRIEERFPTADRVLAELERDHDASGLPPWTPSERHAAQLWVASRTHFMVEGILRPLLSIAAEHAVLETFPEAVARREKKRDQIHRWPNEIAALMTLTSSQGAREKSQHERFVRMVQVGPSTVGKQVDVSPDPHIEVLTTVVERVKATDPTGWRWFWLTYVELTGNRSVLRRGKRVREVAIVGGERTALDENEIVVGVREGESAKVLAKGVREGTASLPAWSRLAAGPQVTSGILVADREGLLEGVEPDDHAAVGTKVADRVKAVRRSLRAALAAVELDARPRWLVPRS